MSEELYSVGDAMKEFMNKIIERHNLSIDLNMSEAEKTELKIRSYNDSVGNLNEIDGWNCNICKNKGHYFVVGEDGKEAQRACKCLKMRAILRAAKKSGLGDVLSDCRFDKFDDTEEWQKSVKRKAMAFCNDEAARWFFIGGQVGSGKSFICTAIAAHYIKAGRDVKYMLWSEEAKKLKALVNDSSYHDEIEPYKSVEVLYIDDFLKVKNGEAPTAADINLAFEIINHRLLSKDKITIISSEKMLDEIMDYDEATMSRIYQKTGDYKINIPKDRAKNYRLKGIAND